MRNKTTDHIRGALARTGKPLAVGSLLMALSACGDLSDLAVLLQPVKADDQADTASTADAGMAPAAGAGAGNDATMPMPDEVAMTDDAAKPMPMPGTPAPGDSENAGQAGGTPTSMDSTDPDKPGAGAPDQAGNEETNDDAKAPMPSDPAEAFRMDVLAQVNALRGAGAVCGAQQFPATTPVSWQVQLQEAALGHSEYMQQTDNFSHTGQDNSSPAQRLSDTGYSWRIVGENIAAGYPDIDSVMQGWMQSPGHCRNIMNREFTEIAVVVVDGTDQNSYANYWTMMLASPMSADQ